MFVSDNIVDRGRYLAILSVIVVVFLVLISRFYSLQIHQHQKYSSQADANRIREVSHQGPRGLIFDRFGTLLVDNRFTYMLSAIPWEVKKSPQVLTRLSRYLDVDQQKLESRLDEGYRGAFIPVRLASGLKFSTISRLEEHRLDFPGVMLSNDPVRFYASDASLAHVLGYLREIDESELEKFRRTQKYQLGDLIGWNGLEREYESILCGAKGYQYLQVNAIGQEIGLVEDREPIQPKPGYNLYLSLDVQLQQYAESLFDTLQGTVVVLKPETGEILSFVSAPSYDLSVFAGAIEVEDWHALQADSTRPLFNRAAAGTYPPGSTFKLITAIAALEEDVVSPEWTVNCPGYYRLGRRTFKCWKSYGHGRVDMLDAIEQSCNVYFYTLIRKVGIRAWAKYAKLFGFGTKTGIDLPEEASGLIPDQAWMDRVYGKRGWTEGHLLNMTVGQGNILVTPLQMAHYAGILATDGLVTTPHFGVAYETEEGQLNKLNYPVTHLTDIDSTTYQLINQ
ncbi:MAG TPA: penicillin-binding protein 2, partial [bacterium]|nr:penicillin-binding protein 2 [bacterium]